MLINIFYNYLPVLFVYKRVDIENFNSGNKKAFIFGVTSS